MNFNRLSRTFALSVCLLSSAFSAFGEVASGSGWSLEPETVSTGLTRVLWDTDASSGKYIAATSDGTTLAKIPVRSDEAYEVWVRYRGLPLVLKNGEGMEISRIDGSGTGDWQWVSMGQFEGRAVSGGFVEVFSPFSDRKAREKPSGLDLVVVGTPGMDPLSLDGLIKEADPESLTVPDADVVLKSEAVESVQEGAAEVGIQIDWSTPTGRIADRQYSLNVFNGFDPKVTSEAKYAEGIAYMDAPVLRYHNMSGMMKDPTKNRFGWMNEASRTWDAGRIAEALDPLEGLARERVITIGEWPHWMDEDRDGMLDKDQYEAFAQLCADLVRILNVEQDRGIQYFEVSNERDMVYWLRQMKKGQPLEIDELAKIYNRCAEAMKAVDPRIKVGGPAACRGDLVQPLKQFAILTRENLDFLSYHAYASGDASETDVNIYNRAGSLGKNLSTIRRMLDQISPGRKIELHLNEYNICYTHRVRDKRMSTHKGAVFDALVFVEMVENGADVGNAWNACDNVYGKMGRDFTLRPPAHAFRLFNTRMVGEVVEAVSDHPDVVVSFAVTREGARNWVLINRSPFANQARVEFVDGASGGGNVRVECLSETGLSGRDVEIASLPEGIELPPNSVTFFSLTY